jgi:hypothetical protein
MQAENVMTEPDKPRANPLQVARAVASAFFGVRRGRDHHAVHFTPAAIIVTGIIGAVLFVVTIVTIVKLVTP